VKVRYTLARGEPICSGCGFPVSVNIAAACANCGKHAGTTHPQLVVECDYQHAGDVPPEHVFPGIVGIEDA
jgi:hypothetical protein